MGISVVHFMKHHSTASFIVRSHSILIVTLLIRTLFSSHFFCFVNSCLKNAFCGWLISHINLVPNVIGMNSSRETAKRLLYSFVPSYIQNRYDDSPKPPTKIYTTSALDGLRGVAALFVFFFHILFSYTDFHEYGYGQSPEQTRFLQLPFIRLIYSGHAMVVIFFVVGGYVFSLKPLKLIRSGQSTAFLNTLVSSVFRRAIRLYAPAIIATFITMATLTAGLWEYQRQFISEDRSIIWYADNHIERTSSIWAQLADWLHQTKLLTNVFTYYNDGFLFPYYPHYDPHLWTIPIEYRSSMLLAMCLLGFSQCRPAARLLLVLAIITFCIAWDRWELVCFLAGSMLCEIDMATNALSDKITAQVDAESKPEDSTLPQYERMSFGTASTRRISNALTFIRHSSKIPFVFLAIALYLLSAPPLEMGSTPGYAWISCLTPTTYTDPKRWPHTLGTLILVATLTRSPVLRRPFESAFAQYLGKISFSLYIVHGPLIHIVGYRVTPWIWLHITGMDEWQWAAGLLMGSAMLAICVALVADWFWRVVEGASMDWAKRFEKFCFVPSG
jgi:peptidoglycan/LPS O-acetylase OafA/YrhL